MAVTKNIWNHVNAALYLEDHKHSQQISNIIFDFVLGPYHCVCAVLRSDAFPEPDDLQSEEQGAAGVYQKDSEQAQTCCCFSHNGRQHSVLARTGKMPFCCLSYTKTCLQIIWFLTRLFELYIVPIVWYIYSAIY